MTSKLLVLAMLALSAAPAVAEDLSATISTCAGVGDDRARLACYDGLAARAKAAAQPTAARPAAPPSIQPAPAPVAAVAPPPSAATKVDAFGAETIRKPDTPEARAQEVDEIKAKVATVNFSPSNRFTVTLDNGQVWRQIEADTSQARFHKGAGDKVEISRGMLGSYNLVIEGVNMLYKVRRVR